MAEGKARGGETYVALFKLGLVNNPLSHARVLEDVLTEISVHLEYAVGGLGLGRRIGIGTRFRGAIALLLFDLGHRGGRGRKSKNGSRPGKFDHDRQRP